jgi:hypothetical protein
MTYYKIVRFYQDQVRKSHTIRRDCTLEQVLAHCCDIEASSETCTKRHNVHRTKKRGPWFDGYTAQD